MAKNLPYNAAADKNKDGKTTKKELNKWEKAGRPTDKLDLDLLGQQFGYAGAYLQNPENAGLVTILTGVIKDQLTNEKQIAARIEGSDWYKSFYSGYQTAQNERARMGEAAWNAKIGTLADQLKKQFAASGAQIDDATARKYAEQMTYGSSGRLDDPNFDVYDNQWLSDQIANTIDFTKTKTVNGVQFYDLSGAAQKNADTLYKLAYDYGMDSSLSNSAFTSWFQNSLKQFMAGNMSESDIADSLREQALQQFPSLAAQINSGVTLREAIQPYTNTIADVLEMNPEDISLNDDLLQRTLNSVDESGKHKPMNLYETKLMARKDKRWRYTETANNEYQNAANTILKSFGFQGV